MGEEKKISKYDSYQDSGKEWIGEIPKEWDIRRIKYLFTEINEKTEIGNEDLLSVSQYTGVSKKADKLENGELLTNAHTLKGYKKVFEGDLVSNIMLAWNGSLGFSPYDGITSPAYSVYRLKENYNEKYFHYLFRTNKYKDEFKKNSSGVIESRLRLYTDDFFSLWSLLPSYDEQIAITNFLDEKTTKIDQAIAQKEKLIELLKERRQIVTQQAVTKGLDPTVKMKDSGIEWIGEIPEHWEVKRLKYLYTSAFSGGTPSTDHAKYWDGGIAWISSADVKTPYLSKTLRNISEKGLRHSSSNIAQKGSVIIVTRSGILQHTIPIAILMKDMAINQDIKCFELRENLIIPNYLLYYVNGQNNEILVQTRKQGATVESIEMADFYNLPIPMPSIREQSLIFEFINEYSIKIDESISLQNTQIEKLKEYKATLIDSAVTGKINVSTYGQ